MNIPENSQPSFISVSGLLFDSVLGRPIDSSPIAFTSNGSTASTMTNADGQFSVELSHTGDWTIEPDKTNHDTYYFFSPATIAIVESGDLDMVSVQGDSVANAHTLKNYASNAFVALRAIFEERMAKYNDSTLTEQEVQREMLVVYKMATNAFSPFINALPPDLQQVDDDDCDDGNVGDNICCATCYRLYANDPVRLNQCLCCPACKNC